MKLFLADIQLRFQFDFFLLQEFLFSLKLLDPVLAGVSVWVSRDHLGQSVVLHPILTDSFRLQQLRFGLVDVFLGRENPFLDLLVEEAVVVALLVVHVGGQAGLGHVPLDGGQLGEHPLVGGLTGLLVLLRVAPPDQSLQQDVQSPVVPRPVPVHQQPHLHHVVLGVGGAHGAGRGFFSVNMKIPAVQDLSINKHIYISHKLYINHHISHFYLYNSGTLC